MTADEFNALYPVGTPVVAYPLTRPEDGIDDLFERLETVTRTPAWTLGHGDPVVSVNGYAGGICLTHIDPVPAEQRIAAGLAAEYRHLLLDADPGSTVPRFVDLHHHKTTRSAR